MKITEIILESQNGDTSATNLSIQQLATISDQALDTAYHYGRSTPGNTFGWQANLKSAQYAKQMIDSGVTDIEAISDAIHKGWNVTAKAFVKNPNQFDDTEKLKATGKLPAKLEQRAKLMNINYSELPEEEKEKDRVVARAMLQAIHGQQDLGESIDYDDLSLTQYIEQGDVITNTRYGTVKVLDCSDKLVHDLPEKIKIELSDGSTKIVKTAELGVEHVDEDSFDGVSQSTKMFTSGP